MLAFSLALALLTLFCSPPNAAAQPSEAMPGPGVGVASEPSAEATRGPRSAAAGEPTAASASEPRSEAASEPRVDAASEPVVEAASFTAFERPFALAAYVSGWAGSYLAGGVGGRARWEPFAELGVEVFGEGHVVEWSSGIRHDHQIGFNLYTPITIAPWLRLRPLFGFCSVFSLVEPTDSSSPRADDVLFGAHAGLGIEMAIEAWGSFFVEAQGAVWAGHDRTQTRWTGVVEDTYAPFGTAQLIVGMAVHLGDP